MGDVAHFATSATDMAAAVVLGGLIGFERQVRGRNAGIRTNALVCVGACLFVLLGTEAIGGPGADPTRVAAQVVSGIGFLGAGVILRNGVDVHGVTTAATLWCAAAIGCLAGAGQTLLAVLAALVVVGTNAALRPVSRALDRYLAPRRGTETPQAVGDYLLEVVTTEKSAARVRAIVVADVSRPNLILVLLDVHQRHEQVVITVGLSADSEDAAPVLEQTVRRLGFDPKVISGRWWREQDA